MQLQLRACVHRCTHTRSTVQIVSQCLSGPAHWLSSLFYHHYHYCKYSSICIYTGISKPWKQNEVERKKRVEKWRNAFHISQTVKTLSPYYHTVKVCLGLSLWGIKYHQTICLHSAVFLYICSYNYPARSPCEKWCTYIFPVISWCAFECRDFDAKEIVCLKCSVKACRAFLIKHHCLIDCNDCIQCYSWD